jgi:hypothetical protein
LWRENPCRDLIYQISEEEDVMYYVPTKAKTMHAKSFRRKMEFSMELHKMPVATGMTMRIGAGMAKKNDNEIINVSQKYNF